jgi:hypothetical protein
MIPCVELVGAAMSLIFLRTPANPNPGPAGFFDLGDVGTVVEMNWHKTTPYSRAQFGGKSW